MYPILFKIADFTLYSYGVFVALGFLAGISFALREARRVGEDPEKVLDLCFWILIAAIVGSRLMFILLNIKEYIKYPAEVIKIWRGGLIFYGGVVLSVIAAAVFMRRHKLNPWKVSDIVSPGIALGLFFGRLGCFLAGCCYGKPTDFPWAVTFKNPASLATLNVSLHPTQLYSSLNGLLLFLILLVMRRFKKFDGQITISFFFLYAVTRSIIAVFRKQWDYIIPPGSLPYFTGFSLSTSQFTSILVAIVSLYLFFYLYKKALKPEGVKKTAKEESEKKKRGGGKRSS
ncbi:MAG: prolipoprotein diacylglyceryl transferase [Deltaproteobacteria bacterium]|nr:MAG: prolipoprotein diacylglyceryl transferase [Deltaproteobacteria bacterium]